MLAANVAWLARRPSKSGYGFPSARWRTSPTWFGSSGDCVTGVTTDQAVVTRAKSTVTAQTATGTLRSLFRIAPVVGSAASLLAVGLLTPDLLGGWRRDPRTRSPHQGDLARRVRGWREEPRLDRVARSGHGRVDRRAVQEQVVEQQCVARTELGPDHRRVGGEPLDHVGTDGPVEDRAAGAGLDDVVEAPRQQVHAGCIDAAVGEGDPDVQGADAATQEGSVLVPVGARRQGHPAEGALVRRQHRPLAEVLGDHLAEAQVGVGLEELVEQPRGIGSEDATGGRDPVSTERLGLRTGKRQRGEPRLVAMPRQPGGRSVRPQRERPVDAGDERFDVVVVEQTPHTEAAVREDVASHGVGIELRRGDLGDPGRAPGVDAFDRHRPPVEGRARLQVLEGGVAHLGQALLQGGVGGLAVGASEHLDGLDELAPSHELIDLPEDVLSGEWNALSGHVVAPPIASWPTAAGPGRSHATPVPVRAWPDTLVRGLLRDPVPAPGSVPGPAYRRTRAGSRAGSGRCRCTR